MDVRNAIYIATLLCFVSSATTSLTDEELKYTFNAAVVEYLPLYSSVVPTADRVETAMREYLEIIANATSGDEHLDIILFPESTIAPGGGLSTVSTVLPEPFTDPTCYSTNDDYKPLLRNFSCAAIKHNTTIVINLTEKEDCTGNNQTGDCPTMGAFFYNTNVAFDEKGVVIARYRKYHLFGEERLKQPSEPEIVTLTTASNDTFGTFTCFDILFNRPALDLLGTTGVRNVLFPSMWYSELPYLTSLQVQQMWAQEHNVNLLASGASGPYRGSGGSGLYAGRGGAVEQLIVPALGGTRIIKKRLPRLELLDNPFLNFVEVVDEDIDELAIQMDHFHLITDSSIANYTSAVLDTSSTEINQVVCNGQEVELCCEFDLKISVDRSLISNSTNHYTYHLAVFSGIRSFSGVRDAALESCGVIACLNESVASCGQRFTPLNYSTISWPVTFEKIVVSGNFSKDENKVQHPNSLLAHLKPVAAEFSTWSREEFGSIVRRKHALYKSQNRLMTFGILGRDFNRDDTSAGFAFSVGLGLSHYLTVLLSCVFLSFRN